MDGELQCLWTMPINNIPYKLQFSQGIPNLNNKLDSVNSTKRFGWRLNGVYLKFDFNCNLVLFKFGTQNLLDFQVFW